MVIAMCSCDDDNLGYFKGRMSEASELIRVQEMRFIEIKTDGQTYTYRQQTDRQADRQTDRGTEKDKKADTETKREGSRNTETERGRERQ